LGPITRGGVFRWDLPGKQKRYTPKKWHEVRSRHICIGGEGVPVSGFAPGPGKRGTRRDRGAGTGGAGGPSCPDGGGGHGGEPGARRRQGTQYTLSRERQEKVEVCLRLVPGGENKGGSVLGISIIIATPP